MVNLDSSTEKNSEEIIEIIKKLNSYAHKLNESVALYPMLENNLHNINFSRMEAQMIIDEITGLNARIAKSTNEIEEKQELLKSTSFFNFKAKKSLNAEIKLLVKNQKTDQIILKNYYTKLGITEYQLKTLNNSHPHSLNPVAVIREYKKIVETMYNPSILKLNELLGESFLTKDPDDLTLTPLFSYNDDIVVLDEIND